MADIKKGRPSCARRAVNPLSKIHRINEGKIMRRTLSVAVLFIAFCCPVSAGIIHNPPPTPLLEGSVMETADGETIGGETDAPGWSDSLTKITFDLLAVLPALF
jgi:hypothetical protein